MDSSSNNTAKPPASRPSLMGKARDAHAKPEPNLLDAMRAQHDHAQASHAPKTPATTGIGVPGLYYTAAGVIFLLVALLSAGRWMQSASSRATSAPEKVASPNQPAALAAGDKNLLLSAPGAPTPGLANLPPLLPKGASAPPPNLPVADDNPTALNLPPAPARLPSQNAQPGMAPSADLAQNNPFAIFDKTDDPTIPPEPAKKRNAKNKEKADVTKTVTTPEKKSKKSARKQPSTSPAKPQPAAIPDAPPGDRDVALISAVVSHLDNSTDPAQRKRLKKRLAKCKAIEDPIEQLMCRRKACGQRLDTTVQCTLAPLTAAPTRAPASTNPAKPLTPATTPSKP